MGTWLRLDPGIDALRALARIKGSVFQAVAASSLMVGPDSGQVATR